MGAFIGQDVDGAWGGAAAAGGGGSYRERKAARDAALRPAFNEAVRRRDEAERDRPFAGEALTTAAAALLFGEGSEEAVEEAEAALDAAHAAVRRWSAAMRAIDDERGVIRAPGGEVIS